MTFYEWNLTPASPTSPNYCSAKSSEQQRNHRAVIEAEHCYMYMYMLYIERKLRTRPEQHLSELSS